MAYSINLGVASREANTFTSEKRRLLATQIYQEFGIFPEHYTMDEEHHTIGSFVDDGEHIQRHTRRIRLCHTDSRPTCEGKKCSPLKNLKICSHSSRTSMLTSLV